MNEEMMKNVIKGFLELCDFVEESNENGCGKCPLFHACYRENQFDGLRTLMEELKMDLTNYV